MVKSFKLFEQHLTDLRRVSPKADDVFICPICFTVIHRRDVNRETVDLGHIWPGFLRNQVESDEAKHQQVLLCKSCNSSAGSRGDNEMQKHEQTRRGQLPSKVCVYPPRKPPFELDVFVTMPEDGPPYKTNIRIHVPQGEWTHNERWTKFREVADGQTQISLAVNQFTADWKLAQAGWLTSAYLFAFYTFGYRYVFQSALDPVRDYILQSFEGQVDDRLYFDQKKDIAVQTCKTHNYQEPQIIYQMKTQGSDVPHHLEISLLDYHVRLPIPLKVYEEVSAEFLPDPQAVLAADATGHVPHDAECLWEETFSEPDYEVMGSEIRKSTLG